MKSRRTVFFCIVCFVLTTVPIVISASAQTSGNQVYWYWYAYDKLAAHREALVSNVFVVDAKYSRSEILSNIWEQVQNRYGSKFSLPILNGGYKTKIEADESRALQIRTIETMNAGHGNPVQWTFSTIMFMGAEEQIKGGFLIVGAWRWDANGINNDGRGWASQQDRTFVGSSTEGYSFVRSEFIITNGVKEFATNRDVGEVESYGYEGGYPWRFEYKVMGKIITFSVPADSEWIGEGEFISENEIRGTIRDTGNGTVVCNWHGIKIR